MRGLYYVGLDVHKKIIARTFPSFYLPEFEQGQLAIFGILSLRGEQRSFAGPLENGGDPVGEGVVVEVRDAEEAFGDLRDVIREDGKFEVLAEVDGGEEGNGDNDGHHVAEAIVVEKAKVFEVIALLDEADRFLDHPTGEVALSPRSHAPRGNARPRRSAPFPRSHGSHGARRPFAGKIPQPTHPGNPLRTTVATPGHPDACRVSFDKESKKQFHS